MKSFRSFMVSQSGELSLEQAQEMYDKYQLQYIEDVSKHFFENSKYEEWFREKYDPLLQQNRAEELQAWSQRSSASFRQQLIENYSDQIHSIRLYSPPGNKDLGVSFPGHHLEGHSNRTLVAVNVPAACTRATLVQAIKLAIAEAKPTDRTKDLSFDRLSLSFPSWNHKGSVTSFDRVGWITLGEGCTAEDALKVFRDVRVEIPHPVKKPEHGDSPLLSFRLQASVHCPKHATPLPDFMSLDSRIEYDTKRATSIAAFLDELRDIPQESSLSAILEELSEVDKDQMSNTDRLDISLAYLRRVHLFVYYSGKKCSDEAELLSVAPSIVGRSVPPYPPTEKQSEEGNVGEGREEAEVASGKESKSEIGGETNGSSSTAINDKGLFKEYTGRSNPSIASTDKRIADILQELSDLVEKKRSRKKAETEELIQEEQDAQAISVAQNNEIDEVVEANCIPLGDNGKVRCAVSECKKLFKGKDFLKKHFQNKHLDMAMDRLVSVSEPYMKARFEGEDVVSRPLPRIEIEVRGRIEERSVKEVREDNLIKSRRAEKRRQGDFDEDRKRFAPNRGGDGVYKVPDFYRPQQMDMPRPPRFQYPPVPVVDPNVRTLNAYRDVDAPVAVTSVDDNFGVALPPPKKRKLVIKK